MSLSGAGLRTRSLVDSAKLQSKPSTFAIGSARPSRPSLACAAAPQQLVESAHRATAAFMLSMAVAATAMPQEALAVPQTSACATTICDGNDYSGKDLRKEFYTKGSLKGANFSNTKLMGVAMFGANLEDANLENADMSDADLGQANLNHANLTNAVLRNAIVSRVEFKGTTLDNADFTDAIIRKDINDRMCKTAKGVNPKTGVDTRESLNCP